MNEYWISWYSPQDLGGFALYVPWWRSGWMIDENDKEVTIFVAAVRAESADAAMDLIEASYDTPPEKGIEWRFVEELTEPYPWDREGTRFPLGDWMEW